MEKYPRTRESKLIPRSRYTYIIIRKIEKEKSFLEVGLSNEIIEIITYR